MAARGMLQFVNHLKCDGWWSGNRAHTVICFMQTKLYDPEFVQSAWGGKRAALILPLFGSDGQLPNQSNRTEDIHIIYRKETVIYRQAFCFPWICTFDTSPQSNAFGRTCVFRVLVSIAFPYFHRKIRCAECFDRVYTEQ